jgi:hypothetical protein
MHKSTMMILIAGFFAGCGMGEEPLEGDAPADEVATSEGALVAYSGRTTGGCSYSMGYTTTAYTQTSSTTNMCQNAWVKATCQRAGFANVTRGPVNCITGTGCKAAVACPAGYSFKTLTWVALDKKSYSVTRTKSFALQ